MMSTLYGDLETDPIRYGKSKYVWKLKLKSKQPEVIYVGIKSQSKDCAYKHNMELAGWLWKGDDDYLSMDEKCFDVIDEDIVCLSLNMANKTLTITMNNDEWIFQNIKTLTEKYCLVIILMDLNTSVEIIDSYITK